MGSWHIHYTTNTSEFSRFYNAVVDKFQHLFPPSDEGTWCPFGPNWGSHSYKYVCYLGDGRHQEFTLMSPQSEVGGEPWTVAQRAFFVPVEHIDELWQWSGQSEVRGYLDVMLHPNTGCMHDDHGPRGAWLTPGRAHPKVLLLEFPCNMPGTGCNDSLYEGPPSCGCSVPVPDDAPEHSCKNCIPMELPPTVDALIVT